MGNKMVRIAIYGIIFLVIGSVFAGYTHPLNLNSKKPKEFSIINPPEVCVEYHFKQGWNVFTFPYQNDSLKYASNIYSIIPYTTDVAKLLPDGIYVVYNFTSQTDFEINNTFGYLIHVSNDVTIKLWGKFINEWTTNLQPGWNLLPIYNSSYTATKLFSSIPDCDFISEFNNTNKSFLSIPKEFIYDDIQLNFGDVLFVHLTQSATFTQYGDQYTTKKVKGILFYDPTALNYNSSLNPVIGDGFIVVNNSEIITVQLNYTYSLAINGTFYIVTINGINYIYDYIPEQYTDVNSSDFVNNYTSYGFHNIELSMNAAGITMYNHTFGVSTNENFSPSIIYVYLGKTTLFFNDVKLRGVCIPLSNFNDYGIFNIDVFNDANNFTYNVPNLSINNLSENSYLIVVDNVTFTSPPHILEGDVMDVYTPEDLATLGALVINANLNSSGFHYISNMCKKIDEQIISMLDKYSTNESINFSLIISSRELSKDKLTGMVKLRVYPVNYTMIENSLGVNFTPNYSYKIHVDVWVSIDNDPVSNSSYTNLNVTDLWGLHEKSVNLTAFAIGTNFSTVMYNLKMALGEEDNVNLDYLSNFSAFRDPGFVVLIDQNFFDYTGDNYTRLFAFAIIPNYIAGTNAIRVLNIKGVVYNISKWFPDRPNQWSEGIPYNIPVIIPDSYGDGILDYPEVRLWNLDSSFISNNFTVGITTYGWVTGTTMKTIAKYGSLIVPELQVVKYSPIDVGIYDVSDRYGSTYYHTALVTFNMPIGNTYLGRHFKILGIYVNLSKVNDWLQQIYNWCGDNEVYDLLNDFKDNFTVDNTYIHMLNGFIIGLRLIDNPISTQMKISRLHVRDLVYGGGTTKVTIFAYVVNNGMDYHSFLPKMRFFITSPHGNITVMETQRLLSTPYFTLNMSATTPAMTFEKGIYKVDAYLLESVNVAGYSHKTADHASTTFKVWDISDPFSHAENVYDGLVKTDQLAQGESHFYKMYMYKEDILMVKLKSLTADFDLYLYSTGNGVLNELTSSTNRGLSDEEIWYEANSSGYMYIEVYDYSGDGNYSIWFFRKPITNDIVNTSDKRTPSIYYDSVDNKYIVAYAGITVGYTVIYVNEYNTNMNLIGRHTIYQDTTLFGYVFLHPKIIRYNGYYYCFFELYINDGVISQWELEVMKYNTNWNSVWTSPQVILDDSYRPWNIDVTYANGYFWTTYENGNNGQIYVAKINPSDFSVISHKLLNASTNPAAPAIFYMNNSFYISYSSNAYTDWLGNQRWNLFVERWDSSFSTKLEWHMIGINGDALNSSEVIDSSIFYYNNKFFLSYSLSKPDWGGLYTIARTYVNVYGSNWNFIQRIPINLDLSNATFHTYVGGGANNKLIVVYDDYVQIGGSGYINNVYMSYFDVPQYTKSRGGYVNINLNVPLYSEGSAKNYNPLIHLSSKNREILRNHKLYYSAGQNNKPPLPHFIYGKVVKADGFTPALETMINITNENTSENLNAKLIVSGAYAGYFYFDLGNSMLGWSNQNVIYIYLYNSTGACNYTVVTALVTQPYNNLSVIILQYGKPLPPRNLIAISGNGFVNLTWNAPLSNGSFQITEYKVYRDGSLIATVSAHQLWYNDTNVVNGQTYTYYITAVNSAGESDKSNEVQAMPYGAIPEFSVNYLILLMLIVTVFFILLRKDRNKR